MNLLESMTPASYLRAILQRWPLLVLVTALCTGAALAVSLSSETQYDATTQLLLRDQEPINSLVDPNGSGARDPERALSTEIELIKIGPTADLVRRNLGLTRSTDELLKQIETQTDSTSDIVELQVRDSDPVLAARIANAFAASYVRFRVQSARKRYADAAELAQRQLLALSAEQRREPQGIELQKRRLELETLSALQTGGAQVVRRASVPTSPSRPRPKLSAAIGLVLGLLLGVGVALLLTLVDRRFKDEHQVEEFFGLPILAAIPRPARRAEALDDPAQREAYGLLAANLRLASHGTDSSVIMITSPSPQDGKTSVTMGVARAYARLGMRVMIIEADLRRPTFGRYTDVSFSAGLTGVLAGASTADELLWLDPDTLRTVHSAEAAAADGIDGAIAILPAGDVPDNPQRALSDPGMRRVVKVARTLADVVLFDSAPLGTVNDATMLAPFIESIVLVARVNQTTKDAARRAIRTVNNLDVDALGVVVTDAGDGANQLYYSTNAMPPAPARVRSR